mmetsp:Transcript_19381/g.41937  ORF Transcript_19381/g.41937 Transcript_19381/m.41937 type:complete len:485 (+) Transcript_19381:93-1547(+)
MQSLQHHRAASRCGLARSKHSVYSPVAPRCSLAVAAAVATSTVEDKWLAKNLAGMKDASLPASLSGLHSSSWGALSSMRMPSTRNEEYRFTDITPLLKSKVQVASGAAAVDAQQVQAHALPEASHYAVVVNGVLRPDLSKLNGLPAGTYIGSIQGAPAAVQEKLGTLSGARGGPFAVLNGAAAQDVLAMAVPAGQLVEGPLHVLYLSTGGSQEERHASAPRLLVHAGAHSAVEVVEEFVGAPGSSGHYFTCGIAEVYLEESAQVKHGYVQREASDALHFRGTLVQQAKSSQYRLTEASLGSSLSRHDVGITQEGEETDTELSHFLLCGSGQLHDLHSKLELNHPRGKANQLHKCIASHSTARGVFDGNVKVNKLAQQTDARQLSRNLLLVPRATVNVKPNLQIIADDVKCTHGCAVSDLSDEELFYFRARGIDAATARQALVASFGAEVVQRLQYKSLLARIQADVAAMLKDVDLSAGAGDATE